MLFLILGPHSLPVVVKDMQTEQLLYWSGTTDIEHTTSDSNEEASSNRAGQIIKQSSY